MTPPEGPILDSVRYAASAIWYNGFWWGCLVGLVVGVVLALLLRVANAMERP